MEYYTTESVGLTRSRTPEGFLVCEGVPVARTGEMIYGPGETPIEAASDGRVRIRRSEKEVFNPDSIASLAGKPLCDEHPPVDVAPENWQHYTRGVVMNPRRGDGEKKDFLLADLIVFDADLIRSIEDGKVEVSCGYNPEYFPMLDSSGKEIPGKGEQANIIYNHLALVERGRCGPRCSIGDSKTTDDAVTNAGVLTPEAKEDPMGLTERIRRAFSAKDTLALDAALDEIDTRLSNPVEIHNHIPLPHRARDDDPNEVEIHNHMPADDEPAERQEMAERIKAEQEKGQQQPPPKPKADDAGEPPPWFKDYAKATDDRFKALHDQLSNLGSHAQSDDDPSLQEWASEESQEPEHMDDSLDARDENESPPNPKTNTTEILGELEFEAPPGTNDRARKARDSSYLMDSFQETIAKAEILAPGIRIPTYDRKAPPTKTLARIIGLRRTALDLAYNTQSDVRGVIDGMLNGRSFNARTLKPSSVRMMFNAASAVKAGNNTARAMDRPNPMGGQGIRPAGQVQSLAELNKRNQERYRGNQPAR